MRIPLQTCVVRSWRRDDATSLTAHANDREVSRHPRDAFPFPYTEADAEAFLRHALTSEPETVFAIEVDGTAGGGIGLRLGDDVHRLSAEIGYWLGRAFRSRGVMSEALPATTDYAIRTFGLTRVFALPFEWNAASVRVLEKSGYVLEGTMRRAVIKDGEVVDQLLYAFVP